MTDFTGDFDYERLVREEKEHFAATEITADLKEGGGHANASWDHYWRRVGADYADTPYASVPAFLEHQFVGTTRPLEILSLGSGFCGHEIAVAERLRLPHRITCTDLNEALFARARAVVEERKLAIEFRELDLNFIALEADRYDVVLAHAVVHHVINLEHLFAELAKGLRPTGVLSLTEVVGPNRRLLWEENERLANALLDALPAEVTGGLRLDVQGEEEGMEGIRQEEILPVLHQHFEARFELRHGAFMRFLCTHPDLGRRLDPASPEGRRSLDFLIDCDQAAVRHGLLRPLEVYGFYRPRV